MSLPMKYEKITARQVNGLILASLDAGSNGWVDQLAMRTSSDSAAEEYAWLGNVPAMQEFIANRTEKELREFSFTISNKDYEITLPLKKKDLRRDKLGVIQTRVNQLTTRALDHPAKLLSTLVMNGESSTCYDGQFFFDTDHVEGDSGTQSNDIGASASTATAPTATEMGNAIMKGIQNMYGFKDDQGEPINQSASNFTVMVPTTFMGSTLEALTALLGDAGKSQLLPALEGIFNITPVVNPRLTWTDKFALFRTDEAAKPFILQEEEELMPWSIGEDSEHWKKQREALFGIDWAGNVGYGYWQFANLVTFS